MEPVQSFNPNEPWDARSAEALTRLYESEEGNLSRPAPRERARFARPQERNAAGRKERGKEPADRTWIEAHLSRLAKRLQDSLAQAHPKRSLAALNERLDVFEQRFSTALGRVAQRADMDSLKSIEANVMELAAQLDRARDRLERIGAVEEEVRGLARKLDEADEQRAGALERLLRDCMAEWRESEQRTAGALHSLEEAVNRLGDAVDAMEASKPAPDLTVPPLVPPELHRPAAPTDSLSRLHAANGRTQAAHFYHAMLDAADYAPTPDDADKPTVEAQSPARPPAAVEWSGPPTAEADHGKSRGLLAPAGSHVMAMRARLRQSPFALEAASPDLPLAETEAPPPDASRRASLGLLLMTGAAVVAGTTYFLYRAVTAPLARVRPAMNAPGAPELADPAGRHLRGEDAS